MSTLSTNLFLAAAALVVSPVFTSFFHSKVSTSNDQGASGYMLILVVILHLLFLALISVAAWSIQRRGGFEWIAQKPLIQMVLLGVGILSMIAASAISVMFWINSSPTSTPLTNIMRYAPSCVLILMVGTGFILNNPGLSSIVPAGLYKIPLFIFSAGSFVGLAWSASIAVLTPTKGFEASIRDYEKAPSVIQNHINEINEADAKTDLVRLLEFSKGLYPEEVRQKAIDKIQSDSSWQSRLIEILEGENAFLTFGLLADLKIDSVEHFLTPTNTGILSTADWIRAFNQGTSRSGYYADQHLDLVAHILQTADRLEGKGVNYLPAIKAVRAALDEPVGGEVKHFDADNILDQWIARHS